MEKGEGSVTIIIDYSLYMYPQSLSRIYIYIYIYIRMRCAQHTFIPKNTLMASIRARKNSSTISAPKFLAG